MSDLQFNLAFPTFTQQFFKGDEIEFFGPKAEFHTQTIEELWNEDFEEMDVAPRAKEHVKLRVDYPLERGYILRKKL